MIDAKLWLPANGRRDEPVAILNGEPVAIERSSDEITYNANRESFFANVGAVFHVMTVKAAALWKCGDTLIRAAVEAALAIFSRARLRL
jgi:hypothetical protein